MPGTDPRVAPAGFGIVGQGPASRAARRPGLALCTPLAALVFLLALAGWWFEQPAMLWAAIVPAVILGLIDPSRLVLSIAVTTPTFPVLRLAGETVGAAKVSSKGLFLFVDDPLVLALGMVWLAGRLRFPGERREIFPGALAGLAVLYPLVIAVNAFRLEPNQTLVSALYYLKWLQYACLLVLIPQTLRDQDRERLAGRYLRIAYAVPIAAALFGAYELAVSIQKGSYTRAASFPRVSSFFGSLDPALYGASEDPVNFGVWAVVMGCLPLAAITAGIRRRGPLPVGALLASGFALAGSASRAPVLAAGIAYARLQRVNTGRLVMVLATVVTASGIVYLISPELLNTVGGRFLALAEWDSARESSAMGRLTVAMNSPVFEIDQYWLTGHGHSTYRFIAEEHQSRFQQGLSRSLYSFPLTAWYDAGPLGLLLWILLFRQLGKRLRRIRDNSPDAEVGALAGGLCAALWALAAASLFGEVPYNWRVMGSFYVAAAVCLAADEVVNRRTAVLLIRRQAAWQQAADQETRGRSTEDQQ
jgi:hypothetical protein